MRCSARPSLAPLAWTAPVFAVSGAVNLRESDRPYLVWDSHQRGLAVSVWPTGHKS